MRSGRAGEPICNSRRVSESFVYMPGTCSIAIQEPIRLTQVLAIQNNAILHPSASECGTEALLLIVQPL